MPTEREPSLKRRRLAAALRAQRERAGLTTRELAERLGPGWSQTKVSRREGAQRRASVADVEAWADATHTDPVRRAELIDLASGADVEAQTWATVYAEKGVVGRQGDYAQLNLEATHIAIYQPAIIPGLAQTAEYARRTLELMGHDAEKAAETAAARVERQSVLYLPGKRIDLVVTEAALRLRVGPPDVMRAQLDKLTSVATLDTVTLAVIPLDAEVRALPLTSFVLREFEDGEEMVIVETIGGETKFEAPDDVAPYRDALGGYLAVAATGEAATALIREAGKHL